LTKFDAFYSKKLHLLTPVSVILMWVKSSMVWCYECERLQATCGWSL